MSEQEEERKVSSVYIRNGDGGKNEIVVLKWQNERI
jgi:hypothetical protein